MRYEVDIFDADPAVVNELRRAFSDTPSVTVELVERMRYLEPPGGLDVLYLPPNAAESFRSRPLIHESEILRTSPNDPQGKLPAFVIAGPCLRPDDPRDPIFQTRLLLSTVFQAIRAFNEREPVKLERVGFWGYNLLTGLSASQLRDVLLSVVPELRSDTAS